jgi:hypothetical protein
MLVRLSREIVRIRPRSGRAVYTVPSHEESLYRGVVRGSVDGCVAFGVAPAEGQAADRWASPLSPNRGADFNGDGQADLAVTGVPGWTGLPVAFSAGTGAFKVTNSATPGFTAWASASGAKVLPGDYNGDGRTDLAATGAAGWTGLPVAFSNGNGSFQVTNVTTPGFPAWASDPSAELVPPAA